MFSDLFIEKVKDANDIVNVVSEYVTLERKGKDFFGLCPFHNEKTASFSVVPSKQIYYCFGCGKGGNVFHFIMEQERLSFVEAVEFLAEKAGIPIERTFSAKDIKEDNLRKEVYAINKTAARFFFDLLRSQEGRTAQEYLTERMIKVKTANTFGLGYSSSEWTKLYDHVKDKGYSEECLSKCGLFTVGKNGNFYDRFRNRLMFPIFDASGNVVGFGGRRLSDAASGIGSDGHKEAKYINSTETPVYIKGRNLYGLNFVKAGSVDKLIIVEGYMDVIAMHQAGFTNSVASLGTALTERQAKLMKKYTSEIYICYDADTAGQKATLRGLDILKEAGCNVRVMRVRGNKDPDEFIKANGAEAFESIIDEAVSLVEYKVMNLSKELNISDIDGKTKFAVEVSRVLASLDNRVERELYIEKISKDYNIGVNSLTELVEKSMSENSSGRKFNGQENGSDNGGNNIVLSRRVGDMITRNPGGRDSGIQDKLILDEKKLLVMLTMVNGGINDATAAGITPDTFSDERDRALAVKVYDRIYEGMYINESSFLSLVDERDVKIFIQLISKDCKCEHPDEALKQIIYEIRTGRLELEIKQTKEEIALLESQGSSFNDEYKDRLSYLNSLILQKAQIKK